MSCGLTWRQFFDGICGQEHGRFCPSAPANYAKTNNRARYFGRSPYRLGPDHIRQYQAHLFRDRKLLAGTITIKTCALRFLYVKTLKRPYLHEHIPFPKRPRPLPTVLSPEKSRG